MAEPLIDRDALASLMDEVTKQIELGNPYVTYADATMSYLRGVLTPEALTTDHELNLTYDYVTKVKATGADLHHRIFGEDK